MGDGLIDCVRGFHSLYIFNTYYYSKHTTTNQRKQNNLNQSNDLGPLYPLNGDGPQTGLDPLPGTNCVLDDLNNTLLRSASLIGLRIISSMGYLLIYHSLSDWKVSGDVPIMGIVRRTGFVLNGGCVRRMFIISSPLIIGIENCSD